MSHHLLRQSSSFIPPDTIGEGNKSGFNSPVMLKSVPD